MSVYRKIKKTIKEHEVIVIARHIGADPDALGSQVGLKEIILENYPEKKVYAIGKPAAKFKYLGKLDVLKEAEDLSKALLITVDVPDIERIDGANPKDYKTTIKMDHHPVVDVYADVEYIDETSSSASQIILEFALRQKLTIPVSAAEKLYIGLVADTNRFMFSYTSPKTFKIVSELIETTGLKFYELYERLYMRNYKDLLFESYIGSNMTITKSGVAYIYIDDATLKEYKMEPASAGNLINNFKYIKEYEVWAIFTEDKQNSNIRGSIRSRGPIINDVASGFNGGGHIYASGVRLKLPEEIDNLIEQLNEKTKKFKKEKK